MKFTSHRSDRKSSFYLQTQFKQYKINALHEEKGTLKLSAITNIVLGNLHHRESLLDEAK